MKTRYWESKSWKWGAEPISIDQAVQLVKYLARTFNVSRPIIKGGSRLPKGNYVRPRIIRLSQKNLFKGSVVLQFARHLHYHKDNEISCRGYDCQDFLNRLGQAWTAADRYFKAT